MAENQYWTGGPTERIQKKWSETTQDCRAVESADEATVVVAEEVLYWATAESLEWSPE